ncbi:MAG: transposase domain-containing protein, partial [Burkholderiales bacterium]|nr:transposase domain-containing protein [Burkholderiales bacterium]
MGSPRQAPPELCGFDLLPLRDFHSTDPWVSFQASHNATERALRPIAVGRKAWLFFGSSDHAQAAANLFSLIASCKLHGLDAESYLADVIRVVPYWPRDR